MRYNTNRHILIMVGIFAANLAIMAKQSASAPPNATLEILASKSSWADTEWTGHAFLIISIPTDMGSKEDTYGFYPAEKGVGRIIGPGIVQDEFLKNPARFSRVTVSVRKEITEAQRRAILKEAREWNDKRFVLSTKNCIDFVRSAAETAGFKVPERSPTERPDTWVTKLRDANQ